MVSIMPGIESRAPERTETSSGFFVSPNFLPVSFSSQATAVLISFKKRRRKLLAVLVVIRADFGGDGEARRHGQADAGHGGEVRAFAAEQRLHGAVAIGARLAEVVDHFADRFAAGRFGGFGLGVAVAGGGLAELGGGFRLRLLAAFGDGRHVFVRP